MYNMCYIHKGSTCYIAEIRDNQLGGGVKTVVKLGENIDMHVSEFTYITTKIMYILSTVY
jgi:hypothetical protein